jgi:O-antigen ligase
MLCALSLFALARRPAFVDKPRTIITFCILSGVVVVLLEVVIGIKGAACALLGRSTDLTGRALVWERYLAMARDPIIGYGYEMFYSSAIMKGDIENFASTHNGYLEMYLNLGVVGLLFVLGWIVTGLRNVWKFSLDYSGSMLQLAIIFVAALNNWTESVFAGTSNMWVLLFVAIMVPPEKMVFQNPIAGGNMS